MRKVNETGLAERGIVARQLQDGLHFTTRALHREVDHTGSIAIYANEKREITEGALLSLPEE